MPNRLGFALLLCLALPADAQVIHQLTDVKTNGFNNDYAVDDAGTVMVSVSNSDPFGTNPDHSFQIFKWTLPGGAGAQITNFPGGVNGSVSISDDGLTVVFDASSDPAGQNNDRSTELFQMQSDGTGLVQLTAVGPGDGAVRRPVLSGSGNRVLFLGTIDPSGTNASHREELFALDTGTLVITQLTQSPEGSVERFSISDDGTRVVFDHSGDLLGPDPLDDTVDVFKVDADGQNLAQLTTSTTQDSRDPVISGNGLILAFEIDIVSIASMTWTGIGPVVLASGSDPSITDNGAWIYYQSDDAVSSVSKVSRTGGAPVALTSFFCFSPVVAGSDSRVVFATIADPPGFNNPDLGGEIAVVDSNGSNLAQITDETSVSAHVLEPEITPDGTRIVFNTGFLTRIQADGSDLTPIIVGEHPTITADGNTIVFAKFDDLSGVCTGNLPLMIFRIQADGTGQTLLSPPCDSVDHNALAADGSVVIYQGGSLGDQLLSVPGGGGPETVVVDDDNGLRKHPALNGDGVWAVWHSNTDFGGANPNGLTQVFRGRTDGTPVEMLTTDPTEHAERPDVSADGQLVVFNWRGDPLGTNPENNSEIFLYDAVTLNMQQLTTTTSGSSFHARISDDGEWVYFLSGAPIFGLEPGNLFRVRVSTGLVERAGGRAVVPYQSFRDAKNLAVNGDGSLLTFASSSDLTGGNGDGNFELWTVDFDASSGPRPAPDGSGLLEWDADPRAVRYDAIRGDVANLQPGAGGTVDLGAVVCLENDSGDTNTLGFEDTVQPTPGQVFFFTYRGSQGVAAGPGSYGQGSGGGERVAAGGDCSP